MSDKLLSRLGARAQAGSKPRCHWVTHGAEDEVSARLSALASPYAVVTRSDRWMPRGFDEILECQLHKRSHVLNSDVCDDFKSWWLAPASSNGTTPNLDIASTCSIDGMAGLLLVEAKAHRAELDNEEGGRRLDPKTPDRNASHEQIGAAIEEAAAGLTQATGLPVRISRDNRYQMSNRFAWSWKLASVGVPVVLVYLAFLRAADRASWDAIESDADWERLVKKHSQLLFPGEMWNHEWMVDGTPFVPIIRSLDVPLAP